MNVIHTKNAPQAIGPYSQAIEANGLLFASGQIPLDPATMEIVGSNVTEQTDRAITNLAAVLAAGGSGLDRVVKTTVYMKNMGDFPEVNAEYARHFGDHKPARATVEVAALPKNVLVEIDAIALID